MSKKISGIVIVIAICLLCLICSIITASRQLDSAYWCCDTGGQFLAVIWFILSGILGLGAGLLVVLTILPKTKPTPKYLLVLYGLIPVLTPAFFIASFYIIFWMIGEYFA